MHYVKSLCLDYFGVNGIVYHILIINPKQTDKIKHTAFLCTFLPKTMALPFQIIVGLGLYPDIPDIKITTSGVIGCVTKMLEELDLSKSPGPNNIPSRLFLQKYPLVLKYYSWIPYIRAAVA